MDNETISDDSKCDLQWHELTVTKGATDESMHFLLDNCYGKARHSKITAIYGTTGSGKTTLIKALTGRMSEDFKCSGEVLIDDKIKKTVSWIHAISYIDDEFEFMGFQSVYESLCFTVRMLNMNISEDKLRERVEFLVDLVGLSSKINMNVINLSIGEKKLFNIAVALAEDPSVLILDDPFALIDYFHVHNLFKLFQRLTDQNKTIIYTFKNPNSKLLECVDSLIILSLGTTIFQGSFRQCQEHFANCGFVCPKDFSFLEFVYITIDQGQDNEIECTKCIQNAQKIKDAWLEGRQDDFKAATPIEVEDLPGFNLHKIIMLYKRHHITFLRNGVLLNVLIIQKIILFISLALVYSNIGLYQKDIETRIGIVSSFVLNATERAGTLILCTFEEYRKVIIREIYSGVYSPTEAYWAKFLYESSLGFLFLVVYIIPLYWIANVNDNFDRFLLFIFNQFTLTNFIASYSIVVGVYTDTHLMATIKGGMALMLFVIFSGIFVNIATMNSYVRWLVWLSPMYYAYESNLQVSMNNLEFECDRGECFNNGEEVIQSLEIGKIHYIPALGIQWAFILFFLLFGWFSYVKKYKPKIVRDPSGILNKI